MDVWLLEEAAGRTGCELSPRAAAAALETFTGRVKLSVGLRPRLAGRFPPPRPFAGFAAGAVAGAFGMYALNVALARDGGALGGEALVIPLVVLLLWAGYCLGHARETVAELLELPADEIEPADNTEYWHGYTEGYDDALATMEFARPPRKRPTKKRRRSDRQALPERRKGA